MKAFEFNNSFFEYPDEMDKILNYLNGNGKLNISAKDVEELYRGYSDDVWCAGWIMVTDERLKYFANWLSEIEVD